MTQINSVPRFVVLEPDPFIFQDIKDIISAAFDTLPSSLSDQKLLPDFLREQRCPTVVIATFQPSEVMGMISVAHEEGLRVAAVLTANLDPQLRADYPEATFVTFPFSSRTLLDGIMTACARLPLPPT